MKADHGLLDKLEWGDYVRITSDAPREYCIMKYGIICGGPVTVDNDTSSDYREPPGTILYLVESSDGESLEIPAQYLEKRR